MRYLHEVPDMPAPQRVKHVRITLEKAYRLEKMINEFFEITRYNSQQIKLIKESIDLSYMLIQLSDELSPVFSQRGLSIKLEIDEDMRQYITMKLIEALPQYPLEEMEREEKRNRDKKS